MELVSIIVGSYNGSKYIEQQLQSIIDQTYANLEIIIVDDNSQDTTIDIISTFQKKHANIFIHTFDENVGYIKNFERGISLANGKYVALSDQDDWWMPNKIEVLMSAIVNQEHDLVYCDSIFVDQDLQELGASFSSTKNLISSNNPIHFLLDNCISGHACLFKKSLFDQAKPFPDLIPHDWWLTYVAALYNGIHYVDLPLIKYRHHQDNVIATSRKSKKTKATKRFEKRHRISNFYSKCPENLVDKKRTLSTLNKSYKNFSLLNNTRRVLVLIKNRNQLLKIFKKNTFDRILFILGMFFRIK